MYERRRLTPLTMLLLILLIGLFATGEALASFDPDDPENRIGGTIRARVNGKSLYFPTLKSDISATIEGDLATIKIEQSFLNPTDIPLNATYLFPLNREAAVHSMIMETARERIRAVIKKKAEAKATFDKAKRAGKTAALLVQHRPNMFVQNLANLMPGETLKIVLKYSMSVPRIDGAYELVVPLVVGPRFTPKKQPRPHLVRNGDDAAPVEEKSGQWSFEKSPAYPQVSGLTIPDQVEKDRVSIRIKLKSAFKIADVMSKTHALHVEGEERARTITLADGRTIDNRDFVLRYRLAGRSVEAGVLSHADRRGHFFSLLLEPPAVAAEKDITPREMVFVLDTSGSMSGQPMEASRIFMRAAIKSLRPTDSFRIIRFSNDTGEFSAQPVTATASGKRAGIRYVNSLPTGGGTYIPAAIRRAFAPPVQPGTLRLVTFLSDGYIGNEAEVLRLINRDIGSARIYAFGVGSAVNRYLLAEMARAGRGKARFIDPGENVDEVAVKLAADLEAPLLTDIRINWGDLDVTGVTPQEIPDLFAGDSIRIMARSTRKLAPGRHTLTIEALSRGRKARMPVRFMITAPDDEEGETLDSNPLPLIWARATIAEIMRRLTMPVERRPHGESDENLQAHVTRLGLDFSLMTQWTSFVAVSEKVANPRPEMARDTAVPLNQVRGVSGKAYPQQKAPAAHPAPRPGRLPVMQKARSIIQGHQVLTVAQNAPAGGGQSFGFGGSSAPEPGTTGAMILLLLMMLSGWMWHRRQNV